MQNVVSVQILEDEKDLKWSAYAEHVHVGAHAEQHTNDGLACVLIYCIKDALLHTAWHRSGFKRRWDDPDWKELLN